MPRKSRCRAVGSGSRRARVSRRRSAGSRSRRRSRRSRLLERRLTLGRGLLAPLDGGAPQLHGSQLLLANGEVLLELAHGLLARAQVRRQRGQLRVALVELGRAVPEHLLDRGPEPGGLLLAPLEPLDRGLQARRLLLDLAAALVDQRLDCLLVVGRAEERLEPVADAVVRRPPAGPVLPLAVVSGLLVHVLASRREVCRRPAPSAVEFGA